MKGGRRMTIIHNHTFIFHLFYQPNHDKNLNQSYSGHDDVANLCTEKFIHSSDKWSF